MKIREEFKNKETLDRLSKAGAKLSRQMRNNQTTTVRKWDFAGIVADLMTVSALGLVEYSDTADLAHFYGKQEQWDWDQKRWAKEIQKAW